MEKDINNDAKTSVGSYGLVLMVVIVVIGALLVFVAKYKKETLADEIGISVSEILDATEEDLDEFSEKIVDDFETHTETRHVVFKPAL